MHATLLLTALLGLGASAAPAKSTGYGSSGQKPFKFPLSNGFPNVKNPSPQLSEIEKNAQGTLPNGGLPSKIADTTATQFQVIAFNEIFEVAYFSSLLKNITSGHYDVGKGRSKEKVFTALHAVRAQEEMHALGANAVLTSAGHPAIEPCEYIFPVDNFDDAIALAATFTDVVMGTLQDAILAFGEDGDTEFLTLVGGVMSQEGEQTGYYRTLGNKIPSALPFLSRSAGPFAYSALNQMFIVPGSCPNAHLIDVPIFPALSVTSKVTKPNNQMVNFSIKKDGDMTVEDLSKMSLAFCNQQNVPVVEKIQNIKVSGDMMTFSALFPGEKFLMNGLTIAALTGSAGPFTNVDEVASAAKYGPGLIEIN